MKKILIVGAGRSASSLIQYLLKESIENDWHLIIADRNVALAASKAQDHAQATAVRLDVFNEEQREDYVRQVDLVISMLPANFHPMLARTCLKYKKDMLTASYVSPEIQAMDAEARESGIILLNECGLDPGLDHMTALKAIHQIQNNGGKLTLFKSFTGGLVAPESDDNPWHYKFTWNPRNVVLAGQGGAASFIWNNNYKYIPYHKLFTRFEPIHISGYGKFEGYPNRNSLAYRSLYGIENIPTMLRGTLRWPGFCSAWNVFVQLGMTDDTYIIEASENMTYSAFTNAFLGHNANGTVEEKLCQYTGIKKGSTIFNQLAWLGVFSEEKIGIKRGSPAAILQKILEEKWVLEEEGIDMVVMQHQMEYEVEDKKFLSNTSIVCKGEDAINTAMAKTVGWPLGIAAKLVLQDKIIEKGVVLPLKPAIYGPILKELEGLGIKFIEEEKALS